MGIEVWSSDDAGAVLERAEDLLVAEPVLHNLVLTLLHGRIDRPEPGRYWVASDGGTPVGLVFSPRWTSWPPSRRCPMMVSMPWSRRSSSRAPICRG